MKPRVLLLILICMLIIFYIELDELMIFFAGFIFLLALVDILGRKQNVIKKKKQEEAQKEIIYPVIYEDVGEPPYLFPEKFTVKGYPHESDKEFWMLAIEGIGNIFKFFLYLFKKPKKKEDK